MTDAMWKAVRALQGRTDIKLGADLREIVRAVLTAIRDLDGTAGDAGYDAFEAWERGESRNILPHGPIWRAIIDAILKEESTEAAAKTKALTTALRRAQKDVDRAINLLFEGAAHTILTKVSADIAETLKEGA